MSEARAAHPAPTVGGQMKEVYSVGPSFLRQRKFRSAPNVTALWLRDSLAPWPCGATSASRPLPGRGSRVPRRQGSDSQSTVRTALLQEACPWRRRRAYGGGHALRPEDLIPSPDQPLRVAPIQKPQQPQQPHRSSGSTKENVSRGSTHRTWPQGVVRALCPRLTTAASVCWSLMRA